MSKKPNPTSIGLFFVIGLALCVAGLLVFSSRSLFHPQQKCILYFNASLKGLNPGAPVKIRGVTVGSVVEILIRHNQAPDDFSMQFIRFGLSKFFINRNDDRHGKVVGGLVVPNHYLDYRSDGHPANFDWSARIEAF